MKGLAIGAIFILVLMLIIFSSVLVYSSVSPTGEFSRYINPFFSSISEKIHSILEPRPLAGCPTDDTIITQDTILSGEYCEVDDIGADGILKIASSDITLDCNGTTLVGTGNIGQGVNSYVQNITIKNCTIKNYYIGINIFVGIVGSPPDDNSILDSTLTNNTYGITVGGFTNSIKNTLIKDNTFNNNNNYAILLTNGSDNILDTNSINNEPWTSEHGIFIQYENFTNIKNTTITGGIGININNSYKVNVINNTLYNTMEPILLLSTSFSNLNSNIINTYHWLMAIQVSESSDNIIERNEIIGDVITAIGLTNSNRNIIRHNNISLDDAYVVGIMTGANNLVHHNSFINALKFPQAYDSGFNNQWNSSCAGNYWNDYTGIDSDGDEIGDTPYVFDWNQDNLPLMKPGIDPCESFVEPPTNLKIEAIGNDVILTWDPSLNATNYSIYRSQTPAGFDFFNSSYAFTFTPTFTDYGVNNPSDPNYNQEYYYVVRAVDNTGKMSTTTYTAGKFTKIFREGSDIFSLPLEPYEFNTIDWYCDQIPGTTGISYLIDGVWKFHACEMPKDVYDNLVFTGKAYQISTEFPTQYTFVGTPATHIKYIENFNSTFRNSLRLQVSPDQLSPMDLILTWNPEPGATTYKVYRAFTRTGFQLNNPLAEVTTTTYTDSVLDTFWHIEEFYYMIEAYNSTGHKIDSTYSSGFWRKFWWDYNSTFSLPFHTETRSLSWHCSEFKDCYDIEYINDIGHWQSFKTKDINAELGSGYLTHFDVDNSHHYIFLSDIV